MLDPTELLQKLADCNVYKSLQEEKLKQVYMLVNKALMTNKIVGGELENKNPIGYMPPCKRVKIVGLLERIADVVKDNKP